VWRNERCGAEPGQLLGTAAGTTMAPFSVMQFISSLDQTKLKESPTMPWHDRQLKTSGADTASAAPARAAEPERVACAADRVAGRGQGGASQP
jgi:hypothetical protein